MAIALVFGLFAFIGLLMILLDFAAMANDPTPSQYQMNVAGVGLMIVIVCGLIALAALADSWVS